MKSLNYCDKKGKSKYYMTFNETNTHNGQVIVHITGFVGKIPKLLLELWCMIFMYLLNQNMYYNHIIMIFVLHIWPMGT